MANLAYGSSGSDVRKLQQELKKAGYNIAADGVFGAETQAAVEAYQRANGLGVDGIAGNQTLGSLGITSTTPDPTKTSYYTGNSGKYQLGDWVGGDTYSGGGAAPAASPANYTGMGGVSTGLTDYWNEGLTTDQIIAMQKYYGTPADGKWGPNSIASAGNLSAQQAWQQYQQETGAGGIPLWTENPNYSNGGGISGGVSSSAGGSGMMGFEDFYNRMGGADYEKRLRETINASVQQAVDAYEAQRQQTEQDSAEMARQAYVAKMLGQKNLDQQLAAGGYAGGAAESTMLENETNYQNNLAEIQRQRQRALDEIQRAIDNARLTGDMTAAEQMAAYMAQVQSYYSDYYDQMLSQQMQMQRAQAEAAQAAASAVTPSVTPSTGGGTNYGGSSYASNGGVSPTTVMMMQQQINSTLPAGQKIAVDGVWGPATTEAAGGMSASQYLDAYESYMNRNAFKNR